MYAHYKTQLTSVCSFFVANINGVIENKSGASNSEPLHRSIAVFNFYIYNTCLEIYISNLIREILIVCLQLSMGHNHTKNYSLLRCDLNKRTNVPHAATHLSSKIFKFSVSPFSAAMWRAVFPKGSTSVRICGWRWSRASTTSSLPHSRKAWRGFLP